MRRETFTTPELVTTRRYILGPPDEGRPGPSDDNDDGDDDDPVLICEGVRVEIGQVVPEVVRLQSTTSVSGKPEKQQSYVLFSGKNSKSSDLIFVMPRADEV